MPATHTLDGILLGIDTARRQHVIDRETVTRVPIDGPRFVLNWSHDDLVKYSWWVFWTRLSRYVAPPHNGHCVLR